MEYGLERWYQISRQIHAAIQSYGVFALLPKGWNGIFSVTPSCAHTTIVLFPPPFLGRFASG
jgi:hypothetical protein